MNNSTKYPIGTRIICRPKNGPAEGLEFWARVTDYRGNNYIVEDQDSDFFELEEDEFELEGRNE